MLFAAVMVVVVGIVGFCCCCGVLLLLVILLVIFVVVVVLLIKVGCQAWLLTLVVICFVADLIVVMGYQLDKTGE